MRATWNRISSLWPLAISTCAGDPTKLSKSSAHPATRGADSLRLPQHTASAAGLPWRTQHVLRVAPLVPAVHMSKVVDLEMAGVWRKSILLHLLLPSLPKHQLGSKGDGVLPCALGRDETITTQHTGAPQEMLVSSSLRFCSEGGGGPSD